MKTQLVINIVFAVLCAVASCAVQIPDCNKGRTLGDCVRSDGQLGVYQCLRGDTTKIVCK